MTRLFPVVVAVFSVIGLVTADKTIVTDGADLAIKYTTVTGNDTSATWTPVQRSPDSCDTPQMLTSRIGDYMTYTFTGTGLQVIGTIGKKRGVIQFTFDGVNSTFDRSNPTLVCDSVLFEKRGLPYQQHTVVATLVGKAPNFSNGMEDGCISIQRIRYFIPGSDGGGSNIGVIAGAVVGGVAAIAIAVFAFWFVKRRKNKKEELKRASRGAFIDVDDRQSPIGPKSGFATAPASNVASPGMVATPFEWNGPGSQYQAGHHSTTSLGGRPAPAEMGGQPGYLGYQQAPGYGPTTPSTTGTFSEFGRSPVSTTGPNGQGGYFPTGSAGSTLANALSTTSATTPYGDVKRDSTMSSNYAVSNPAHSDVGALSPRSSVDPRSSQFNAISPRTSAVPARQSTSSPPATADDGALVDRIAHRLADIMQSRTGGVGVMDTIVPPPLYDGPQTVVPPSQQPPQVLNQQQINFSQGYPSPPGGSTVPMPGIAEYPQAGPRSGTPTQLPYASGPSPPPMGQYSPPPPHVVHPYADPRVSTPSNSGYPSGNRF